MALKIDGLTEAEFQALSDGEMDELVFCDRPVSFRIGSAEILGQFRRSQIRLEVELAHIEGGGEGALPLIWKLASSYASSPGNRENRVVCSRRELREPKPKATPCSPTQGICDC